ncbi:MAG: hypothetical protein GY926_05910, partial [bacterium]|nr:hypothetical protein [bacterium]
MTGRRAIAVVIGILGLLIGATVIAGAAWLLAEDRDDDGFYAAEAFPFEQSSHAIVSGDLDILADTPSWLAELLADPVDVRIQGTSGEELFIGIASTADVDRYLSGVAHDEVTDLDLDGRSITSVDYVNHDGTASPMSPGSEQFWEVRAEGAGPQTVEWSLESGSWTVVVMNADASTGVIADLEFAARISNIVAITWGVLGFGVISLLGGGYLTYRGLRRRGMREPAIDVSDLPEAPPIDLDLVGDSERPPVEQIRNEETAMNDQPESELSEGWS